MLKNSIISTLQFFDLQDLPLTLYELHKFLLADLGDLKSQFNQDWEITQIILSPSKKIAVDEILFCLEQECQAEVKNIFGFFYLTNREELVKKRLNNNLFGLRREKLIKKYLSALKHLPFVRGVAIAGSQALGQQKATSDIDLLIIVAPQFLWLARTVVTGYFQLLGKRRHGPKISDRFCLNHYVVEEKEINKLRNLYTAAEYLKLRPVAVEQGIAGFQNKNLWWMQLFFPNATLARVQPQKPAKSQRLLEQILNGRFGLWLEGKLKAWQLPKIRQEQFILVADDELSFHPDSKQQELLQKFFQRASLYT